MSPEFEVVRAEDGQLRAPVARVAQDAVDETETAYTNDAEIDVERHLAQQLSSRGLRARDDGWVTETAHRIRSGHHVRVSDMEGSGPGA